MAPENVMAPSKPTPDATTLVFQEAADGELHRRIQHHVGTITSGWSHRPLTPVGNFLEMRWCSPDLPAPICEGGAAPTEAGAWIRLSTLHYPARLPEVFGVVYDAWSLPDPQGRRVHVYLSVGGSKITAPQFQVQVSGPEDLAIGSTVSLQVEGTTVGVELGEPITAAQTLLAPGGMTTAGLDAIARLEAEVLRALAEHRVQKVVLGPYEGGGRPPEKTLVALSSAEEETARVQATTELARRRAILSADGEAIRAIAVQLLPPELLAPKP